MATPTTYGAGGYRNQCGTLRGASRQAYNAPLRPGQFRSTQAPVIIKNSYKEINIFEGHSHSCCHNYCDCNANMGMSNFEKWMVGLGVGGNFLGNLFGGIGDLLGAIWSRKPEGAGGKETPSDTPAEQPKTKLNQAVKTTTTEPTPEKVEEEKVEPKTDFQDGQTVRVRDQKLYDRYGGDKGGGITDIQGQVTNNPDGTFSIKDVKNTYTYAKTGQTVEYNGQKYPVYTLIGAVDSNTGETKQITQQSYILMDGQLYQPKDLELLGNNIGSIAQSAPPPKAETTKTERGEIPSKRDNPGMLARDYGKQNQSITQNTNLNIGQKNQAYSAANQIKDSAKKTELMQKLANCSADEFESIMKEIETTIKSQPKSTQTTNKTLSYKTVDGKSVNLQGAHVEQGAGTNRRTFFLVQADGTKQQISMMDYMNIQKQLDN